MGTYNGFTPRKNGWLPFRLDPNEKDAKAKFHWAVARRMPIVFTNLLPGVSRGLGDISTLKKEAGECTVFVEHGLKQKDRVEFGTGEKHPMEFKKMLDELEEGKNHLYLTTVPLEEDENGLNCEFFSTPLTHLTKHFPISPSIADPLSLSTVNLWIGNSKDGSSSNLHHDFHDNIYLLMEGRKRFLIASPDETDKMYSHGTVAKVHHNGLINYSPVLTRADGQPLDASIGSENEYEPFSEIDSDDAEDPDIAELFKELEDESNDDSGIEQGLDRILTYKFNKREGVKKTNQRGKGHKVDPIEALIGSENESDEAGDLDDEDDDEEALMKLLEGEEDIEDDFDAIASDVLPSENGSEESEDDSAEEAMLAEEWAQFEGKKSKQPSSHAREMPPHFSQIPIPKIRALVSNRKSEQRKETNGKRAREVEFGDESNMEADEAIAAEINDLQTHSLIKEEFPKFQKAVLTIIELEKGECLYLPAGWWHEVTSFCAQGHEKMKNKLSPHIALNFWFHPPSEWSVNCKAKGKQRRLTFKERTDNPYIDDTWEKITQSIIEKHLKQMKKSS